MSQAIRRDEYLCAVHFVATYQNIPTECMDDAILHSFNLSTDIIEQYEIQQSKLNKAPQTQRTTGYFETWTPGTGPWFMRGQKSEQFAKQICDCLKRNDQNGLNKLRKRIHEYQNKHAYERFSSIYNYLTQGKV
jgi:hypothetical protein